MTLYEYIEKYKVQRRYFAWQLGLNTYYFYAVIGGSVKPSKTLSLFIEHLTEGKVSYYELRGERKKRAPKIAEAK